MVADARKGRFSKIIVYRASRLGREEEDQFAVYNLLVESLGIELIGIMEPLNDRMVFGFHTIMNAQYRRQFLADSARGMDRAARAGRYTGGIVPLGYRVEGHKQTAHLVPDESIIWGNWTAVRLVQRIFEWLAIDHRSCRWIAQELNRLGVPTAYQRDGRGVRGQTTQAIWRPGRVRNLVVNPVYKGLLQYGRRRSRKSKRTSVIEATVEAIVSPEMWAAAQRTLAENRIISVKNTDTAYLLRSVMKCGLCGLTFCGAQGRPGVWWYRCTGYLAERGGKDHRCLARSIRNTDIEPQVWQDIETMLRNPGDLLDVLKTEAENTVDDAAAIAEAERITLQAALADLEPRRQRNLDVFELGRMTLEELNTRLDEIDGQRRRLQEQLNAIEIPAPSEEPLDPDLLAAIHERLDAGLTDHQRSEIVRLLVKQITVHTTPRPDGHKDVKLVIEYRFSDPRCSHDSNGTRASQNYTSLKRVVTV
jgi:site-specific DNA recombinase